MEMSTPERNQRRPAVSRIPLPRRTSRSWRDAPLDAQVDDAAWLASRGDAAGMTASLRFLFRMLLFEPRDRFKAGDLHLQPGGGDETLKDSTASGSEEHRFDLRARGPMSTGVHAQRLAAPDKFKGPCPARGTTCPGSTRGAAPAPRARGITISADDGQIVVDKRAVSLRGRQWSDPKAFSGV